MVGCFCFFFLDQFFFQCIGDEHMVGKIQSCVLPFCCKLPVWGKHEGMKHLHKSPLNLSQMLGIYRLKWDLGCVHCRAQMSCLLALQCWGWAAFKAKPINAAAKSVCKGKAKLSSTSSLNPCGIEKAALNRRSDDIKEWGQVQIWHLFPQPASPFISCLSRGAGYNLVSSHDGRYILAQYLCSTAQPCAVHLVPWHEHSSSPARGRA